MCSKTWLHICAMSKKAIAFLLLAGGALYFITRQVMKVAVGAASGRIHKVNANGVEVRINMIIINESRLNLDIQNFLGQIFYKGSSLGIVQQIAPVRLLPLQVGGIELKTTIGWTTLGLNAYDIFKIYQSNQSVEPTPGQATPPKTDLIAWDQFVVRGTLIAEGLSIPINTTIFV